MTCFSMPQPVWKVQSEINSTYNNSLTPKVQEVIAQLVMVEVPYLDNYRL